jgi:hypothetical protein
MNHTPAPWFLYDQEPYRDEDDPNSGVYVYAHLPDGGRATVAVCDVSSFLPPEQFAPNGRLMACAPELLQLARLAMDMRAKQRAYFKSRDRGTDLIAASRAAERAFDKAAGALVARAEGRTML